MKASELGIPEAHYQLGLFYEIGRGIPKSYENALVEYKKGSDLEHPQSIYKYARGFQLGLGTERNQQNALNLFRKAAEKGVNRAQLQCALMLLDESQKEPKEEEDNSMFNESPNEEEKNILEAASYLRSLALKGYPEAMYRYAVMLRDGILWFTTKIIKLLPHIS